MSLFDQPYYAVNKGLMSRMGIWPEQSKYVRIILPSTMFAITLTLVGPGAIRVFEAWRDIDLLIRNITIFQTGVAISFIVLSYIQHDDIFKSAFKKIEEHWEMCKNTSAVIVLHKYVVLGHHITVVYSTCIYIMMILFLAACLSPIVLDFIDPMNETRPKIYIVEAEYGVDADKYYWFIVIHIYIVVVIAISMMVAVGSMYILLVVHACALFEVVGFNLKLIENEYTGNKENATTPRIDWNYKQICDCIILHIEAISFADLIEDEYSGTCGVVLSTIAMITVISGLQLLINWNRPEVLIQQVSMMFGQVIHLYIISIPGQELMDRSGKIHTIAYNLNWPDMSAIARKLLIPILMRSNKPCCLTAGKVYILSVETFGSAIRIVISYFMIFAQMI